MQGATQAGPLRTSTLQSAGGSDPLPQGANIGILQGVRIATPFFGTGYNFCIGAPRSCSATVTVQVLCPVRVTRRPQCK